MLTRLICSRHAEANRLCKTMALRRHFRDRAVSARLQKNRSSPRRDTRAAISLVRSLWIRWPGLSRRWMCLRRTCSSFQTAARQGPRAMRIVPHRSRCSTFTVDRRQLEADARYQIRSRPRHPFRSANTSPCRVCRGLAPPRTCARPGAQEKGRGRMPRPLFSPLMRLSGSATPACVASAHCGC